MSAIGDERRQQENTVDIARAEAAKTEGLLGVQNEFEADPDYTTYGKRAPVKTGDVVNKAGELIRDPSMRERWKLQAQNDAARVNDGILDKGVATQRDAETIAFDDALEVNRRIYVDPATPDDVRQKARKDIEGAIQAGQSSGLLDPKSAEARRKSYLEDADFSRGQLEVERNPNVVARPLPADVAGRAATAMGFFQSRGYTKEQAAGIVGNLVAESSLRASGAVGDNGTAFGIAQWRGERLTRLKRFANSQGHDWQDFGTQLAFVDMELQNHETDAYRALKAAKTIDEATAAFISYERPQGWTPQNPRGGHNYSGRLKNAAGAAGAEINPDWYQRISPEQRAAIDRQAETASNQRNAETRAQVEVASVNAPIAIQNTGMYSGALPTPDQFFDAYGPQEGADRYNNFLASVQTSQQAYDMRTMSASDIQTMVSAAKPVSSGDGAALETKRYETLSNAAESTLKARESDPASYARQAFPSVDQAWKSVRDPASYQSAVAASIAAQEQLGVKNVRPLPKAAATEAVTAFNDQAVPEANRIAAVGNVLMATPDPAQRKVLFNQLVEAGLPEITEGAFNAMSRGDTGAARRLFQAAIVDPSKLPGTSPEKPADIDEQVQATLMDTGQIGDIYYGLTDGTAENYASAQRDSKLISNAVQLRLRSGESLDQAIASVSKDLYGDVQVLNTTSSVNAQVLLPADVDPAPVVEGLTGLMPKVRGALTASIALPGAGPAGTPKGLVAAGNIDLAKRDEAAIDLYKQTGAHLGKFDNPADATAYAESLHAAQEQYYQSQGGGTRAVLEATTANYAEQVLAEGYFRNSGDGFVFIDPFVGGAIADQSGNPMVFTMPEVLAARPAPTSPAPMTDQERERKYMEDLSKTFGPMGGAQ
jgi:hypothetical protein